MPFLSVIIPVYNAERYLAACLESVVRQGLEDCEVIVVDDGATDGSPQICDEYAARYPQFRVIHQENRGVAAARNRGIDEAQGEYVVFLDSDDFWVPGSIGPLLAKAREHDLDVLGFKYVNVPEDTKEVPPFDGAIGPIEVLDGVDFVSKHNFVAVSVVYLAKREHLVSNRITFPAGHMVEDAGLSMRVYLNAKRMAQTECVAYCYRYCPASITHNKSEQHLRRILGDFLYAASDVNSIINEHRERMTELCYERCRTRRDSYVFLGAVRALRQGQVKEYLSSAKEQGLYPFKRMSHTDYPGLKFTVLHRLMQHPWLWNLLSKIYRVIR